MSIEYITGFIEADGWFIVTIEKDKTHVYGYRIRPTIGIRTSDKEIIELIKANFPDLSFNEAITDEGHTIQLLLRRRDDVLKFILVIEPYLQTERVKRIVQLMKELIGVLDSRKDKKDFLKALSVAKQIRALARKGKGQKGRYDVEKIIKSLE